MAQRLYIGAAQRCRDNGPVANGGGGWCEWWVGGVVASAAKRHEHYFVVVDADLCAGPLKHRAKWLPGRNRNQRENIDDFSNFVCLLAPMNPKVPQDAETVSLVFVRRLEVQAQQVGRRRVRAICRRKPLIRAQRMADWTEPEMSQVAAENLKAAGPADTSAQLRTRD
jgi:hypothetical protein